MPRLTKALHTAVAYTQGEDKNIIPIEMTPNDIRVVLKKLMEYEDIGTIEELRKLKENMTFTILELAKIAAESKELQNYRKAEEQGLLVRLPDDKKKEIYLISSRWTTCSECGSRFDEYSCIGCEYECDSKKEYYVCPTYLSSINVSTYANRLGKTIFLTREEAEKELEELKRKKNGSR